MFKVAAIVLLSVLSVNAAATGTSTASTSQCTPGCLSNCIQKALPTSGCDPEDVTCLCQSSKFSNSVASCVWSNCPSQMNNGLAFQKQMCNGDTTCPTQCLEEAADDSDCDPTDVKCLCNDTNFKNEGYACINSNCPSQYQKAQTFQKTMCGC
ncbi:hypothetical protein VKT23_013606 [Stygiomarasmius scandens]|uniref:CFEM domain-containing protein n=1 Tax=Marasmiellus scandens TaxID=2682957 RepID=A0ABR1J7Q4_9AGAR